MQRKAHTTTHTLEKRIFWTILLLLASLVVLYIYFVSKSIVNVIVREEIEQDIVAMQTEISELESMYLQQKNRINMPLAQSLGFRELPEREFVVRKSRLSTRLTLSDEI